ncbi:MAG: hypothetical protein ACXVHI_05105 [Frankiaceae bacterium]
MTRCGGPIRSGAGEARSEFPFRDGREAVPVGGQDADAGLSVDAVNAGVWLEPWASRTAHTRQWATYYDAADQAGISRIFGGIHPRRRLPGPQHRLDLRPGRVGAGLALLRLNPPYSLAAVSLL